MTLLYISLDYLSRNATSGSNVVRLSPHRRKRFEIWILVSQPMRRRTFESVDQISRRVSWWCGNREVYMIRLNLKSFHFDTQFLSYLMDGFFKIRFDDTNQYLLAILWYPNQVIVNIVASVSCFLHQLLYVTQILYIYRLVGKCTAFIPSPKGRGSSACFPINELSLQ